METRLSILAWRIHGQRSLAGYCLWSHTELDTTEREHTHTHTHTHTKRVQTQTTRLPTPQTRVPPPRFRQSVCAVFRVLKMEYHVIHVQRQFSLLPAAKLNPFSSCLIAVPRASTGALNTYGEGGRPCLVPKFERLSAFYLRVLC